MSAWEERALNGEFGEGLRLALEIIVRVGEFCGAERLIEISHAHVSGISIFNIGEPGLQFLRDLVSKGAKVSTYTTANPSSLASSPLGAELYDEKVIEAQQEVLKCLEALGVDPRSYTCVPYVIRKPKLGEHLAWAESSAAIVANSVFGARTNREGGLLALAAAIAGRTYEAGMHLDENRVPTEVIDLRNLKMDSVLEASLAGLAVGKVTKGIPYVVTKQRLSFDVAWDRLLIKNFLASIATTSSSSLAIIEGLYPEKVFIDRSLERISIDRGEVLDALETSCKSSIALIGCPHLDGEELSLLAREIAKSPYARGVSMVIATVPRNIGAKYVEDAKQVLSSAGIELVVVECCCCVVSKLERLASTLCTPHGKALHYLPKLAGVEACPLRV